jgi:hypothetical protein
MNEANESREAWIEQTARLIRIVDHDVSEDHALALAAALWERPGSERVALDSVAEQIAAARLGVSWRGGRHAPRGDDHSPRGGGPLPA